MARVKKTKQVSKFGGVDQLGTVKTDLHGKEETYDSSTVEAKSEQTHLEDDLGQGNAVVIRCFTFQMNLENPELFIERNPSKQDLFNSHVNGIEATLWKDGLKFYTEVAPRITFDTKKFQYSIFVAALPRNGYLLNERPQTLSEIAHG
jgi:hypothetical protein